MQQQFNYLAIGDSYTIGEQVELWNNFPYITVQKLREKGVAINAPEVLAKTALTTNEWMTAFEKYIYREGYYNFVTLLIGVNNQYRGYPVEQFATEFDKLLQFSIKQAGQNAGNVMVLSIPDWSITPFAKDKGVDSQKVANEIDQYNQVTKEITEKYGSNYINITEETRKAEQDLSLLAQDQLHYSAKEHGVWADMLIEVLLKKEIIQI